MADGLLMEERQRRWRQFWRDWDRWEARYKQHSAPRPSEAPALYAQRPLFPESCRGLTCGATTRSGTPASVWISTGGIVKLMRKSPIN